MQKQLLSAAWVVPMSSPTLRDAAVVFDQSKVIDVGLTNELRRQHPDAEYIDLGNSVLLPGLINAHTHLELSVTQPAPPPADGPAGFTRWLLSLPQRTPAGPSVDDQVQSATQEGIAQSLRCGVTTIGDISKYPHLTRAVLRRSPIRCVSFGEVLGLHVDQPRYQDFLMRAMDTSEESNRLQIALTPHAPYTVSPTGYRQCLQLAREHRLPLATHLAESPDETEFLEHHRGPFRELWETLGKWAEGSERCAGGPVRCAQTLGLLDYPTILAHVNYADDAELAILARGRASVVYCPRTHAYFQHPPHRWREMLTMGINVAIGTDSVASSPDLNLLDDLRLLHQIAPDVDASKLFQLVTINAARTLMLEHVIGALARGLAADIIAFPVKDATDPMRAILESDLVPTRVWVAGLCAT